MGGWCLGVWVVLHTVLNWWAESKEYDIYFTHDFDKMGCGLRAGWGAVLKFVMMMVVVVTLQWRQGLHGVHEVIQGGL